METDVVVVGGGVTGVAVLRDLALRGVRAVLVERFDGTGTSGRWHGLLQGPLRRPRPGVGRECIEENTTLRRIAPHRRGHRRPVRAPPRRRRGLRRQVRRRLQGLRHPDRGAVGGGAHRREPLLAPDVKVAFAVPDGGIGSWSHRASMAADAEARGCKVLVRHPIGDGA